MRWQDETPIHNLIAEGAQIDNAFLTVARIGDDRKEAQIGSQPINDAENARAWLDRTADAALGDADEARLRVRLWRCDRTPVRSVQTRVWPDADDIWVPETPPPNPTNDRGSRHQGWNHGDAPFGHASDESEDGTDDQNDEGADESEGESNDVEDEDESEDESNDVEDEDEAENETNDEDEDEDESDDETSDQDEETDDDENDPENSSNNANNGHQGHAKHARQTGTHVPRSPPGRPSTSKPAPRRTAPPTTTLTVRRPAPVATRPQTSTRPPIRVQTRHAHVAGPQYAPLYAPPCPTCAAATTTTALLQSRISELSAMLGTASTAVREATRRAEQAEQAARSRGQRAKDAEAEVTRLRTQNAELSQEVRRLRIEEKRLDAQVAEYHNGVIDLRNSMAEFDD